MQTTSLSALPQSMGTTECPEIALIPRPGMELAVVACGWFWGPQPAYEAMTGVQRCVVGYSGGVEPNPTYKNMMDYTESVLVEYDPTYLSYEDILRKWRTLGEPYPNKRQYRSAIFTLNAEQDKVAKEFVAGMKHGKYVDVESVTKFYRAEAYHQHFLKRL